MVKQSDSGEETLTAAEILIVREIIKKEERWVWLATITRNTAAYVTTIVAAVYVFWDIFVKFVKGAVR